MIYMFCLILSVDLTFFFFNFFSVWFVHDLMSFSYSLPSFFSSYSLPSYSSLPYFPQLTFFFPWSGLFFPTVCLRPKVCHRFFSAWVAHDFQVSFSHSLPSPGVPRHTCSWLQSGGSDFLLVSLGANNMKHHLGYRRVYWKDHSSPFVWVDDKRRHVDLLYYTSPAIVYRAWVNIDVHSEHLEHSLTAEDYSSYCTQCWQWYYTKFLQLKITKEP